MLGRECWERRSSVRAPIMLPLGETMHKWPRGHNAGDVGVAGTVTSSSAARGADDERALRAAIADRGGVRPRPAMEEGLYGSSWIRPALGRVPRC